jgi:hypothetical protein
MKGENAMENLLFYYVDEEAEDLREKIQEAVKKGLCKDIGHGAIMFLESNLSSIKEVVGDSLNGVENFEAFITNDDQGDYIKLDFAGNKLELSKDNVCHELIDHKDHFQE